MSLQLVKTASRMKEIKKYGQRFNRLKVMFDC